MFDLNADAICLAQRVGLGDQAQTDGGMARLYSWGSNIKPVMSMDPKVSRTCTVPHAIEVLSRTASYPAVLENLKAFMLPKLDKVCPSVLERQTVPRT